MGAGLFLHSFARLLRVDPGFQVGNVLTLRVQLQLSAQEEANAQKLKTFYERLELRLRSLPVVKAVAAGRIINPRMVRSQLCGGMIWGVSFALHEEAVMDHRSGRIMNVASTAAFQPGPLMAVYYATKAYVLSFSQAIANELRGSGVTVTCFCPGATHTGFAQRAGTENSRIFKQFGAMPAERVARDGYRAVMEGKTIAISGAHNWIVAESVRFAPRKVVTAISRWVAEKIP